MSLLEIQSWWEIPCVTHFCSKFSSAFDLPDIDIEDFELALLSEGVINKIALIPEFVVRLLKGCDEVKKEANTITHSNYQMFLRRVLRRKCGLQHTENHFDTDVDFQTLPLRKRLQILNDLCNFRLDSADVEVRLSNFKADSLRVAPLGCDSKKSCYWYFYGTRLYRQDKTNLKSTSAKANANAYAGDFKVICFTEEDWQNLASKFKTSSNAKERELSKILNEKILKELPQLFRERECSRTHKLSLVRNTIRMRNNAEVKKIKKKERRLLSEKEHLDRQEQELLQRIKRDQTRAQRLANRLQI